MSNKCNCQIPNTDLAGKCFKCGGFIELPIPNKQLPAEPRKSWEYKEHFHQTGGDDWDGHYEVTNGDISLCTTDDPDDDNNENSLERVAKALNESGCKFYVNTTAEHALHVENMELRGVLEDLARQKLYGEPVDEHDHMYSYEETVKLAREALKRKPKDIAGATAERNLVNEAVDNALHAERNKMQAKFSEADKQWAALLKQQEEKAQVLVDALREAKVIIQYFHDTVGQTGNSRMVLDNVETGLQLWKEKEAEPVKEVWVQATAT